MKSVGLTILVLFAALVLTLVVFRLPLIPALGTLLEGSLGSANALSRTLIKTCPLLLCGLGITFAWRAGMYNIGGEGQFAARARWRRAGRGAAPRRREKPGRQGAVILV